MPLCGFTLATLPCWISELAIDGRRGFWCGFVCCEVLSGRHQESGIRHQDVANEAERWQTVMAADT